MNPSSAVMDGGPDGATQSSNSMANSQPAPAGPSSRASTASQTSRQSSAANSMSPSPMGSRDVSPTRHPRRSTSSSRLSNSRSRKNSQQDLSPSRLIKQPLVTGLASAARVLSATTTPTLLPAAQQDTPIQAPTPVKPTLPQELKDNPRWPVSPRLRSPSPILNKPTNASRVNEVETPLINVQRPTPSPQPADSQLAANEGESEDPQMPSGIRTPARGPLETVQEVSQPNSPSQGTDNGLLEQIKEKLLYPEHQSDTALHDVNRTLRARPNLPPHESGSDSSAKVESRRTASVPPPLLTRHSSISSKQAKPKPDTSKQTMTVETETVPSIPQMPLSTGTKVDGANGTLKAKPSTETIRPKKEKKKTTRKQPAVVPGTGKLGFVIPAKHHYVFSFPLTVFFPQCHPRPIFSRPTLLVLLMKPTHQTQRRLSYTILILRIMGVTEPHEDSIHGRQVLHPWLARRIDRTYDPYTVFWKALVLASFPKRA